MSSMDQEFSFLDLAEFLKLKEDEGSINVIASRPLMGKMSLALGVARTFASTQNKTVALFSPELTQDKLVHKFLRQLGHSRAKTFEQINFKENSEYLEQLSKLPIVINDRKNITLIDIQNSSRQLKKENGLGLIIINYLELLGNTLGELKALSRELKVPVIVLSQLDRSIETKSDKRPVMSALEYEGADSVVSLYRDSYYNSDCANPKEVEVTISRKNNGEQVAEKIILEWEEETGSFRRLFR